MGRPKKFSKCYDCPPDKEWWIRELKKRNKLDRCPSHLAEYDKDRTWPACNCGGEWLFKRGVKRLLVECDDCGIHRFAEEVFERLDLLALGVLR